MRWSPETKKDRIVTGGNGEVQQSNQFNYVQGLSFDERGNLYVTNNENHRIQKFDIE